MTALEPQTMVWTMPRLRRLPAYDSYQSWAQVNQVSMYAGGLFLTSAVMSFFTDWADIGGTDDD